MFALNCMQWMFYCTNTILFHISQDSLQVKIYNYQRIKFRTKLSNNLANLTMNEWQHFWWLIKKALKRGLKIFTWHLKLQRKKLCKFKLCHLLYFQIKKPYFKVMQNSCKYGRWQWWWSNGRQACPYPTNQVQIHESMSTKFQLSVTTLPGIKHSYLMLLVKWLVLRLIHTHCSGLHFPQ